MNRLIVDIKRKNFLKDGEHEPFTVIENLKFELSSNEFVCIVGPSGCGKTTLLNTVAALDDDFEGNIYMDGENSDIRPSYVFQTPRLLPWRTVLENIQLAVSTEDSRPIIENTLQRLGLGNHFASYPHHLSLGMQRRVALARAFCLQSNLLLMDEPFVSLDQPTARKARKLLLTLWDEQPRNVLFVTHDLSEAVELADRILFLSESPASIVANIKIDIPRSDRTANRINAFTEQLKTTQPNIRHLI